MLATATSAEELTRLALETAVEALQAETGSVLLLEPDGRGLRFRHVVGAAPAVEASLMDMLLPVDAGISGQVMRTGRGIIVADVSHARHHNRSVDDRTTFQTRGLVAAPIVSPGGAVVGVIEALNPRTRPFDRDDLALLTLLAGHAGTALETARLHRAAALASVAHRIGDVGHDVKNMLTPVETGVRTLAILIQDLEAAAAETGPEGAARLTAAVDELRVAGPVMVSIALAGVTDVKERVREIADAVKGVVSAPAFEPTDVRALAGSVVQILYPVAEPRGVALDISGVAALPPVLLDRRRMFSALYNLVHNAIPETPSGGTVWVEAQRTGTPGGPDDRLRLVVRDDGRGMTEAMRRRLFSDDVVSTKPGGTGLGTRIVRGAVEAHGGTVSVASAPGEGACFTLEMPWKTP